MKLEDVYRSAMDSIQTDESFEENTIAFLHGEQASKRITIRKRKKLVYMLVPCLFMMCLVPVLWLFLSSNSKLDLAHSKGVSVRLINHPPNMNINYELVELTPEEIFQEWSDVAFRGTIKEIENIKVSFGFQRNNYWAIASIKVDEVYRGEITAGDLVKILLPCPIQEDVWVEDTEVVSAMRVGMEGIFIPMKYDASSKYMENDRILYLTDICEYGFPDGVRFAFLQTEAGLLYSNWSFDIIPRPSSLDDIEKYVRAMVEQ